MKNLTPFHRLQGRFDDADLEAMAFSVWSSAVMLAESRIVFDDEEMVSHVKMVMKEYDYSRYYYHDLPTSGQAETLLAGLLNSLKTLRTLLGMDKGNVTRPIADMPSWLSELMLPQGIYEIDKHIEIPENYSDFVTYNGVDEESAKDAYLLVLLSRALQGIPLLELTVEAAAKLHDETPDQFSRGATKGRTSKRYIQNTILRYCEIVLEPKFGVKIADNTDAAGTPTGPVYDHLQILFEELEPDLSKNLEQLRYHFREALKWRDKVEA